MTLIPNTNNALIHLCRMSQEKYKMWMINIQTRKNEAWVMNKQILSWRNNLLVHISYPSLPPCMAMPSSAHKILQPKPATIFHQPQSLPPSLFTPCHPKHPLAIHLLSTRFFLIFHYLPWCHNKYHLTWDLPMQCWVPAFIVAGFVHFYGH